MQISPFRNQDERKADREEKREAVLRAAVRMFNAQGFHATSLDDVAASLGISKPTIYHYLGNKDQVLLECVTRGVAQMSEAAEEARAQPGNGLDRLRSFLVRYSGITMDDFGRCVVRTAEEALATASATRFRALKREIDGAMDPHALSPSCSGSSIRSSRAACSGSAAPSWSPPWPTPARWASSPP
jgi:AcrR family transcriptional regulator